MVDSKTKYFMIVLLVVVAISSRFVNINTQGILVDETWVVPNTFLHFNEDSIFPKLFTYPQFLALDKEKQDLVRRIYNLHTVFQIAAYQASDVHPPLFHILNYYWSKMFGYGLGAIRFPAALYFLLTFAALFFLLRYQRVDFVTSFAALALLVLSPFMLFFSNFARPYTLMTLFGLVSSIFCYLLVRSDFRKRYAILYVITAIGVAYTHYYGVLLVVAQTMYLLAESFFFGNKKNCFKVLGIQAIVVLLYLPQMAVMLFQVLYRYPMLEQAFEQFNFSSLAQLVLSFGPAYSRSTIYWHLNIVVSGLMVVLFCLGALFLWRRRSEPYARFWLFFFAVPFLLILIANILKPVFTPRNCVMILTPYLVTCAFGFSVLRNRFAQSAVAIVLGVVGMFFIFFGLYWGNIKGPGAVEDWKATSMFVKELKASLPVYVSPASYVEPLYFYIPDGKKVKAVPEDARELMRDREYILVLVVPHGVDVDERTKRDLPILADDMLTRKRFLASFGRTFIYEVDHSGAVVW